MDNRQKLGAVVVTGASTGIGKAIALRLDQRGFKVFATVRKENDAKELASQASGELTPIFMDVTDQSSIDAAKILVNEAVGEMGLAGLVNNAGVAFTSPLEFVPINELRWLFDVNFFGLLSVTQAFLPLIRQKRGRIVNISSIAAIFVAPFHGPYSASKVALNGLSDAIRLELKPHGVQVSVIICGSINTPIWEKGSQISKRIVNSYPPQASELYGKQASNLGNYFLRLGRTGIRPEAAAKAVEHALTARRAKQTYYVGPDAYFYIISSKLVYGRLRDWMIMQNIRP